MLTFKDIIILLFKHLLQSVATLFYLHIVFFPHNFCKIWDPVFYTGISPTSNIVPGTNKYSYVLTELTNDFGQRAKHDKELDSLCP